ncbi:hypothetical protein Pelo_2550 [Pelomyxa schiedti]|nr:hypothetical protein Pelo_2550 [Pelomyxa schiedti]
MNFDTIFGTLSLTPNFVRDSQERPKWALLPVQVRCMPHTADVIPPSTSSELSQLFLKGKSVYLTDRDLIEVKPNTASNSEHGQIYRFVFRAFQNKEGVFEDNRCDPVRSVGMSNPLDGIGEISDVWPTTDSKGNSFATKVISLPKYAHYIQSHIEEHTNSTLQAKAGSILQKRAESTMTANNSTSQENVTHRANDYPHYLNELNGCQTIPRFTTDFHPEAEASYYIVMEK